MTNKKNTISFDFGKRVADALSDESDRGCVILVASWADNLLRIKLAHELDQGNSDARAALFSSNGPFATFSAKLNVAFCAGWIESDVYHDLDVVRKMRNELAHSIESHELYEEPFRRLVAKLRVPNREYYDWGALRGATTSDGGIVLYTGERPTEAVDYFDVSKLTFRMAASVLIAVLVANLGIIIEDEEAGRTFLLELPEHMRGIPE